MATGFQLDARQAFASVSATNDLRLPGTIDSRAEAKSRSASFDSVGIYAAVENHREAGFPEGTYGFASADAGAYYTLYYVVESDTLPAGSPAQLNISVHYDGSFTFADDSIVDDLHYNRVSIDTEVYCFDGDQNALLSYYGGAGFNTNRGLFEYGAWTDRFLQTAEDLRHGSAELAYTDDLVVNTTVGARLRLYMGLETDLSPMIGADVAFTVDFFNTGSAAISTVDPDVRVTAVVPEPVSMSLVGLGGLVLLPRQR